MTKQHVYIVAFEFSPFPGGQGTYAMEMARAFTRLGHKVTVLAPRYDTETDAQEPFAIHRIFVHQKLDIAALMAAMKILKTIEPDDVLLAADIRAGLLATALKGFRKFKKIIMFHGGEIKKSGASKVALLMNNVAAMCAVKLVGNSSYTIGLVDRYVGGATEVTLLGTARYWLQEDATPFENETLRKIAATDTKLMCTIARLDPRKGHLLALKALRRVANKGLDFKYVICGKVIDEEYAAEVLREVDALPHNFLYVGSLSDADVRRLYARSSAMLLTAQEYRKSVEGFGLVITEAGGQKCPSIATAVGGIVDAIADGKTGFLCKPNDELDLAEKIESLLGDDTLQKTMGEQAYRFTESLTWENTAQKTLTGI